jgi:hypothetical protein
MDEFFTEYCVIEKELINYTQYFSGKTIYCNCDNYKTSNFYRYFYNNFDNFGLKKLICTWYSTPYGGICEYYDNKEYIKKFDFDGDFRSSRLNDIIEESDIIVTNPPFSLFRDFIKLVMEKSKDFIVLGNLNAAKYKVVFPYIKDNKVFIGKSIHAGDVEFIVPDEFFNKDKTKNYKIDEKTGEKLVRVPSIRWYTNIRYDGVNEYDLKLTKKFSENEYFVYDDYHHIINCDKVLDIPMDYDGEIGVPVNYIDKHNDKMFEIIGLLRGPIISDRKLYDRIVLKRVKK